MDDVEIKIEKVEDNLYLTGMACNHITFIVLESIIVALLLVSIDGLMYCEYHVICPPPSTDMDTAIWINLKKAFGKISKNRNFERPN